MLILNPLPIFGCMVTEMTVARTTVVVAALVSPGAKVEIECVATLP